MSHHSIDKAIALVELHQNQIDTYQDIFEWAEESKFNERYSEDETDYNKNPKEESIDEEFLTYCRKELMYHNYKLDKAQQRLSLCLWTCNKNWSFE